MTNDLTQSWKGALIGGNDHIPQAVCLIINGTTRSMAGMPGEGLAHADRPGGSGDIIGHKTLNFAVIENTAQGFVTQQAAHHFGIISSDQFGGNVYQAWCHTQGSAKLFVNLIPGQYLV